MPIYEYQGQQYDIATTDKTIAKQKILAHLGKTEAAQIPGIPGEPAPLAGDRNVGQPDTSSFWDKIKGVGEAGLSAGTGMLAMAGAAPLSIPQTIVKKAMGEDTSWEKEATKFMQDNTYTPRTEKGEDYTDTVGKVMNEAFPALMVHGTIPVRGIRQSMRFNKALENTAGILPKGEAPTGLVGKLEEARAVEAAKEPVQGDLFPQTNEPGPMQGVARQDIPDAAKWAERDTTQMDMFDSPATLAERQRAQAEIERQHYEASQAAIEARQRALEENVARQGMLDRNAAERGRQEQALTGYEQWVEQQRQAANQRQPGDNTPMDFESPYPVDVQQHPQVLQDAPYKPDAGLDFGTPEADKASLPVAVQDILNRPTPKPEVPLQDQVQGILKRDPSPEELNADRLSLPLQVQDILNRPTSLNKGIGRGQKGGIDFHAIAEETGKLKTHLENFGTRVMDAITHKERVVLQNIGNKDFIPAGAPSKDIIAQALAEGKDAPSQFQNMQSGLLQSGMKVGSSLQQNVARWMNWADKIWQKNVREFVHPLEQKLATLPKQELSELMGVLKSEMFARKPYTMEELQAAGATPKQLEAYQQLRKSFDEVFNATNEGRAKLGLEPITKQAAYFASMWDGNYHIPVRDTSGKLIWYVKTESLKEAKKAVKWLTENQKDIDPKKLSIEYKPQDIGNRIPRDAIGQYETMMKLFEGTPMADSIKAIMDQYREDLAFNERGHSVHFEQKANVRGFLGDRPWLSDIDNARAAAKAQVRYLKDSYRWLPLQEAMGNLKEAFNSKELLEQQPNNVQMSKLYVDNQLGLTKNLFKGAENYVAKVFGKSPATLGKFVGDLKTLTYLQQLGLSTGYAIATPIQAFILGPSRHMMMTEAGIKHNMLKTAVDSMVDTAKILATHELYNLGGKDSRGSLSPLTKDALRYMEDNGIITQNLFDEYAGIGEHKGIAALKSSIGLTISMPEKVARVGTFMSFVHHMKDSGMSKMDMFRAAEEATNATLTDFRKQARPLIVDKFGQAGELLYTYKSPLFNYYNSLFEFAHHAKRTGNYAPIAAALVMPALLGGVVSLPGAAEMDGVLQLIKTGVAKLEPHLYHKVENLGIKEFTLKNLPDVVTYGTMSKAFGMQMASRFSTQALDPENPFGGVAPVATELREWGSAGKALVHPTSTNIAEGIYKQMPPIVKGNMEVGMDAFKGPKTSAGQIYLNPNDLEKAQASVLRTPGDENARRLGLTSLNEASQKDANYIANRDAMRFNDARKASVDKMFDAIRRNDSEQIQDFALSYIQNHGDPKTLITELNNKIINSSLTPLQQQQYRARGVAKVMDLANRMQMGHSK